MAGWRLSSVPSWRRGTGILPRWALSITSWWSTSVWTAASMAGCAGIWSPTIALLPCGAHSETCLLGRRRDWLREGLAPYYEYFPRRRLVALRSEFAGRRSALELADRSTGFRRRAHVQRNHIRAWRLWLRPCDQS